MIPYETSRPNLTDVRDGFHLTWFSRKGDVIAAVVMLVALGFCLVFGTDPVLTLVLIAAVIVNAGRVVVGKTYAARTSRDLDTYYDALASQGVGLYEGD